MKSPARVLITDGVHEVLPKGLKEMGYEIDYRPKISLAEVHEIVHGYQGMIINSKILVDQSLIDKAKNLRWVGRLGSGLEIIDLAYAKTAGIDIYSSPQGNAPAVGEHALAMVLALANKLFLGDKQVRSMQWDREAARGWELKYKTVGIIGYGHTGPAFAKTLRGFENEIVAFDKYKDAFTQDTPWVRAAKSAEEVLQEADILSINLPLTEETVGYLSADRLDTLKKGAVVINTSRGNALDLGALIERLESGQLAGACLDVFPNEKPKTYSRLEKEQMEKLSRMPNVVLSPHVAGWTIESKEALANLVVEQIMSNHPLT